VRDDHRLTNPASICRLGSPLPHLDTYVISGRPISTWKLPTCCTRMQASIASQRSVSIS